jgi:hypothetical protein
MLNSPDFIYLWVNPKKKTLAICSSNENHKDAIKIINKRECEIYSTGLFYELQRLNSDLHDDISYRINGVIVPNTTVAEFSVLNVQMVENENVRIQERKNGYE